MTDSSLIASPEHAATQRCLLWRWTFSLFLLFPFTMHAHANPGYGEPLTITTGAIYRVGTLSALKSAVAAANAAPPATILISNGTYVLDIAALQITNHNIMIRSLSGDRDAVIIRGPDEGPSASVEHIFWIQGNTTTIADITFGWCLYHGIQMHGQSPYDASGLWVHNCRIVNCNEQFIKGTSADADPEGVTDGLIENCLFEFTNQWAYQYYTGGIDIHKGANWTVRDNLFRYIRAPDGYAEHAIHFWKRNTTRPQNIHIERNIILNCDRGIGFGLGTYGDGHDGGSSYIRNNFVYNDGEGTYTDVGIGLESANDVLVDNNSVYVPYWAPMEYRFTGSVNIVYRNNLVNGPITARDSAPAAAESNNLESIQSSWFFDLTNANMHLNVAATQAINQGCAIVGFSDDIDDDTRPIGVAWDIGADEYDRETTDSDFDWMTDGWEIDHGLDPTNAADATQNADTDVFDNRSEWVADTDPQNGDDYFSVHAVSNMASCSVFFRSSSNRVYSMEWGGDMVDGLWLMVDGQTNVSGTGLMMSLADTNEAALRAYRLAVSLP